ncbi:hypothetical protein [Streptomyces abikoensis]|uniref:hypothetical protein n=1 Tax=Streptomyces abikoensis TaxID=97398 RepID=UPI001678D9BF|nr:hypothetical protein [Streptomyces abikoensis]GGP73929.1 hypothetical protein GCM10010214_56310 [Streptomyces abikoensis]
MARSPGPPCVSRNRRLYTAEAIGRAVARAQARIDESSQPLTMLTHHEAGDDSTQIVGRVTGIIPGPGQLAYAIVSDTTLAVRAPKYLGRLARVAATLAS